jgi:hypothetical protein
MKKKTISSRESTRFPLLKARLFEDELNWVWILLIEVVRGMHDVER